MIGRAPDGGADLPPGTTGVLAVDLDRLAANWRALAALARPATCAAVVKADAYGLGALMVGPRLEAAGCRTFFVATVDEGLALRPRLQSGTLYVLA